MPLSDADKKWIEEAVAKAVAAEFQKEQTNGRNMRSNIVAIARKLGVKPKE